MAIELLKAKWQIVRPNDTVSQLERQGANLQTKIEELQLINQSLREHDKVKEDVLAHLSVQIISFKRKNTRVRKKTNFIMKFS